MLTQNASSQVLVVDDNAANTALYKRVVNQIPKQVAQCFTHAGEALAWAARHRPSLVVVDYRMPDVDGLEFIRRFRSIPGRESIPLVMLTSIGSPVLWQMALDAGATAYLMKPIDKRQFLDTAQRLLRGNAD